MPFQGPMGTLSGMYDLDFSQNMRTHKQGFENANIRCDSKIAVKDVIIGK